MLDQMRRHRDWLKWSLGLVALAFVIFYIPTSSSRTGADAASGDTVATVEGHEITAGEFRRTYEAQLQAYRNAYGGNMSEQLLKQLGIDQQILQQMVDRAGGARRGRAARHHARATRKCGSGSSRRRRSRRTARSSASSAISSCSGSQRPPMTPAQFEDSVRRRAGGRQAAGGADRLAVGDRQGARSRSIARRNDKVKLAVVSFTADSFRAQVTATDAEVASHFDAHTDDFKIPEKRKIRYLLDRHRRAPHESRRPGGRHRARVQQQHPAVLDARAGARQPHPPQDRRQGRRGREGEGRGAAQAGEGRRRLRGAGEDELRRRGEREERRRPRLLRARAGWCRNSIRSPSRWSRDRSSDVVKTQYGYHIIKVVDKKPATTRPLAEVRQQLDRPARRTSAPRRRPPISRQTLARQITKPADLDKVGQGARPDRAGVRILRARRADSRPRPVAGSGRAARSR